jgi:tetratricopeptide (TPR) repeat protein
VCYRLQILRILLSRYRGGLALQICMILLISVRVAAQSDLNGLLEQARTHEKAGDYAAAARVYQHAIALTPGNPEVLKRFGVLQQTELKFDDSIEKFQQVLGRNPQYPEVNFFLGVSYLGKNDTDHAIQSFQHELATPKPHPRCRYYLALALQSSGHIDEAISQLNQALADNPRDADALYQLARIHKSASLQAVERLKTIDGDSFQLHALMGEIYADEERYSEAIKEYQAGLSKRPDAQGIHFAIGVAYWAQHQLDPAQKEFKEAWKENPSDAMTNLYLGDIAVHERRFADCLGYLRVAQQAEPGMLQVHMLLGKCYRGQNDPDAARIEFVAAIKADPTASEPHYLLAQVYRDLQNPEASARELAEFEKLSKSGSDKAQDHNALDERK